MAKRNQRRGGRAASRVEPEASAPSRIWERLGRWCVLAILWLSPLILLPTLREPFRLPKLMLSEILALSSLLALAVAAWRSGRARLDVSLLRSPAFLALAPLLVIAVVSALGSEHPHHAFQAVLSLAIGVAAILGWSLALPGIRWLLDTMVAPALALAVFAALQYHDVIRGLVVEDFEFGRGSITALAGNVGELGGYLVLPLLLALANADAAASERRWRRVGAWLIAGAGLLYVITLAQVISAMLALAVGIGLYGVLWLVFRLRAATSARTRILTIASSAAGAVLVVVAVATTPLGARAGMLLGDLDNGNLNNLLSGRLDGWRAGQLMFRERPLVGVGPGAFAAEFTSAKLELLERGVVFFREHRGLSTFANAHSEPIEVAAELGALGLLALAWLVVVTARQLWRAKLDPGDRRLVIAALAAFAVLALTWFPSRVAMIAYPNALVLAWLFRREPAPPQDPSSITARARETGGGQRWLGPTLVAALAIALVLECARARSLLLASHILGRSEALAEAMLASGTIDRQYLAAASKRLEHAATLAPGDARIPLALGSHYYLLGNGPEAVRWYRRALEVEPRPEIYLNLGRSLWVGGQREEGGELMRIAALLEPSLQAAIPLEARAP